MSKIIAIILSGLIIAGSFPVHAQDSLVNAVRACKKIEKPSSRLSCFDLLLSDTGVEPDISTKQYSEDNFGARDIKKRARAEEASKQQTLTSGLVELSRTRSDKYVFILENGQIWKQAQSDTGKLFIPKKLDNVKVIIKRGFLGSHLLKIEGKKRSIKVNRLR